MDLLSGQTAPSYDDPLGMIRACHRRIERQLATLDRLQRHLPEHGCDDDARAAARAILRYFDTSAVHHHADEEESLFPRLAAAAGHEAQAIAAELERDHEVLAERWARLRPLLVGIASGQRAVLAPKDVTDMREAYDRHIVREETELLPIASAQLGAAALKEIGQEMAARRNVETGALPPAARER